MIGVILHANPEPVKPVIEKKKPELIPEPVPQPEPEEYNAPMEDIAQELEPEPEVEEAEPEMQEDISQELEQEPDVEEAEPEMQATLEGDTEAVEENVDHGTTTIEQEPAYQVP